MQRIPLAQSAAGKWRRFRSAPLECNSVYARHITAAEAAAFISAASRRTQSITSLIDLASRCTRCHPLRPSSPLQPPWLASSEFDIVRAHRPRGRRRWPINCSVACYWAMREAANRCSRVEIDLRGVERAVDRQSSFISARWHRRDWNEVHLHFAVQHVLRTTSVIQFRSGSYW